MEKFEYVKPALEHKQQAIEYIQEFYQHDSQINGVGGLYNWLDDYEGWLAKLENDRHIIPDETQVPSETFFLVRRNDNKIIGMSCVRLALNAARRLHGQHIGYSIRPTERRKGYNKINLYLALKVCQQHGIKETWLDCDKINIGSAKTMLALGGVQQLERFDFSVSDRVVQYYSFDTDKVLEKYKDIYEPYIVC